MRGFDLNKYLRASRKLDLDGIDFDAVPRYPLSREEVRCLTYMMDIETHTVIYLRDLLTTQAAYEEAVKPLFTLQGPDLVVLGNAGQAWLVGGGPGRLPADRLPTLGSWLADLGLGLDWGGLGLYAAKAVTAGEPLRFTLRLDHRF